MFKKMASLCVLSYFLHKKISPSAFAATSTATPVPSTSSTITTTPASTSTTALTSAPAQFPAETIKWKSEIVNTKDLTDVSLKVYSKFIETSGNHLVIYGLDLNEKKELLNQLVSKQGEHRFHLDLDSLVSKDKGGNLKDNIVLPTYLSIANVNGYLQLSYGSITINPHVVNKEKYLTNLKNKNFEPRKKIELDLDNDVKYLTEGYEEERQKFISQEFSATNQANPEAIYQRIGSVQTFYEDRGAAAPLRGKIMGYWLISQASKPVQETTYLLKGNFTVVDGSYSSYSTLWINQYQSGIALTSEAAKMLAGQPLAKAQVNSGVQEMEQKSVLEGFGSPLTVLNKWPASGVATIRDAQVVSGPKGSYTTSISAQKYRETLPNTFPISFAASFSSTQPDVSVELQQWFQAITNNDVKDYYSTNALLRNN